MLSKVASFMFLPIAALFMGKSEFGSLSFIYPLIIAGQGILTFGLGIGFLKHLTGKGRDVYVLKFNVFLIWFCCNLIVFLSISGAINTGIINDYMVGSYYIKDIFLISYVSASTLSYIGIFLQESQAEGNALKYVIINTGVKLIFIMLVLFSFVGLDAILTIQIIIILLVTNSLFFLYCFISMMKSFKLVFDWPLSKELIHIGFPIFISASVTLISAFSGRLFLNNESGISLVADFSLMLILSQSILLFYTTYSRIYIPALFRKLNNGKAFAKKLLQISVPLLCLLGFYTTSLIYLFFLYVVNNYVENYDFPVWSFGILIGSYIMYPLYISFVDILSFMKKSKILMYINISIMLYHLISGYFLVAYLGVLGAAISFFTMMLAQCFLVYYYSSKLISINQMLKPVLANLIFFFLLIYITSLINESMTIILFFIVLCISIIHFYLKKDSVLKLLKELG